MFLLLFVHLEGETQLLMHSRFYVATWWLEEVMWRET